MTDVNGFHLGLKCLVYNCSNPRIFIFTQQFLAWQVRKLGQREYISVQGFSARIRCRVKLPHTQSSRNVGEVDGGWGGEPILGSTLFRDCAWR